MFIFSVILFCILSVMNFFYVIKFLFSRHAGDLPEKYEKDKIMFNILPIIFYMVAIYFGLQSHLGTELIGLAVLYILLYGISMKIAFNLRVKDEMDKLVLRGKYKKLYTEEELQKELKVKDSYGSMVNKFRRLSEEELMREADIFIKTGSFSTKMFTQDSFS